MSISSTPAASSISDLFVTPDGAKLVIFFQAQNVGPRRAPLAKILQKGGAYLCTDPKDADILLVDPETPDGRQHIRTWVAGGDKVGLHYRWIDACVKAGRMLADGDGWGGFIAVDDGAPLDDDEDDELGESAPKSPLPTPRQTQSPDNPPRSISRASATAASSSTDVDPFLFLQAISDELLHDSDKKLRKNGRRLQAIIPTLFNNESKEDVEMAPPPTMSERARGKQKDVSLSVSTASRKNSVPPVSPAKSSVFSPTPPGALFMKDNDPIKFYVQADYFQRKDLVKNIKRNGGAIASHVKEADYAILYAKAVTRKEYQSSLTSAMADSIPAIEGRFVDDCITRNKVLDYKSYVFAPATKRKRTTSAPRDDTDSSESDEPLSQKTKKLKLEESLSKPAKLPKGSPSKTSVSSSQRKPTSASARPSSSSKSSKPSSSSKTVIAKPPPPKERVAHKYTEEEIKLALQTAFEYWAEDYRRSDTQLAQILHSKMPNHTWRSWQTYMGQQKKKDFDEVRKRAGIQCRKKEEQEKGEQDGMSRASSLAADSQGGASRRSSVPSIQQISPPAPPPVPLPGMAPRTIEQDVERFADFLAFEGGDQFDPKDPMSAYRALSDKSPWKSAQEWGAFWTAEWQRINPVYQKKLEQAEATQQQSREETFQQGEISLGDRPRNY